MFSSQKAIDSFINANIDYIVNVPVTGMNKIYKYFECNNKCIFATREEECVAIATGLALGGKHPLVFIQQSGVGNMLNAFIGLSEAYEIYYPILVLDRGIHDENPVQAYSSFRTIPIIEALENPIWLDFKDKKTKNYFKQKVLDKHRWFITKY